MTLDEVHAQAARALDELLEVQYHTFEQSCIDSDLPLADLADLSEWAHQNLLDWRRRTLEDLHAWLVAWAHESTESGTLPDCDPGRAGTMDPRVRMKAGAIVSGLQGARRPDAACATRPL